ncbi:MAG: ABC transporter permease subunit [Acidimicrobiales bacterium]
MRRASRRSLHRCDGLRTVPDRLAQQRHLGGGGGGDRRGGALRHRLCRQRRAVRWSAAIEYVVLAPVAMPALLLGLAFVAFWLRLPIPLFGTMAILVIAYVARFIPQGFENFASTLVKVDEQLEDSAVTAGAGRLRAVWSITLPLLRSAAASTGVLLFILAFREVTVALFLYTPQTRPLSVVIYNQWSSGSWSRVASMSIVFTAALLLAAILGRRAMASTG